MEQGVVMKHPVMNSPAMNFPSVNCPSVTATDLSNERANPDGVVDWIGEQSDKDVPLSVDLSGVDLVKDGHHDEGVEDHGEVNGGRGGDARAFPVINVE